jgi:tRNA(Ile)-lysidine synthase
MRHDPAIAATRRAVAATLDGLAPGDLVLVAVSGGADSLALAAASAHAASRRGVVAAAVTVDHRLQDGSGEQAERAAGQCRALGLDPVEVVAVTVGSGGGPEAAARAARYAALDAAAERLGAALVLLGHTLDDQAETVLLGLARGSGARSLAAMASESGRYRRPFLALRRETTRAACAALGLDAWEDPHNADPGLARSRVRAQALPALERALGPGVAEALARSARLLRDDADALDAWAATAMAEGAATEGLVADRLAAHRLAALPRAVRTRVIRLAAIDAGAPAGALTAGHVDELDRLLVDWHGQGPVSLPGGLVGARVCDRLEFR